MKKAIFIYLFLTSFLLANEKVNSQQDITTGIGFTDDGFVYRSYNQNGYIETIGKFSYSNGEYGYQGGSIGFDIGKYLVVNYNEKIDFAVKYSYGLLANMNSLSASNALLRVRLGVELISPRQEGINLELLMGQKIQYSNAGILTDSTVSMYVLFNY